MNDISNLIESHVEIPEIFTLAYSFVRDEFNILLSFKECFNLYNVIKMVDNVEGDIIEVGTYGGGSTKLISLFVDNTKKIYTFDTYEGLMDIDKNDVYHSEQYMNNGDSHDYNNYPTPGVKKAFSEFFKDKPEHIIPFVGHTMYDNKNLITQ